MASMTKLSTKEIIEQRDKAFEALRRYAEETTDWCVCGLGHLLDGPNGRYTQMDHRPGCIVAVALGEQQ